MFLSLRTGCKKTLMVLGVLYLALTGGGGCNLFGDFSSPYSDQALIQQAIMQMDNNQWTAAITTLNLVSGATLALPTTQTLLATAYAGRGGLNVLTLAQAMQNMGGLTLFQFLMKTFAGATASNASDEEVAESIMVGVTTNAAARTGDQNTFMVFLELAKLGTILALDAGLPNGTLNPAFQSCLNTPVGDAQHVVTAIGNLVSAAQYSPLPAVGTLSGACAGLGGLCAVYLTANVTANQVRFSRTLVGETALGIGLAVPAETGKCEIPPTPGNCLGTGVDLCP